MTAFSALSVPLRGLFSLVSLLLFFLTVYLFIQSPGHRDRRGTGLLFGLLSVGEYIGYKVILCNTNPAILMGAHPWLLRLGALPWGVPAAALAVFFAADAVALVHLRQWESSTLSQSAVKECIDSLPVGLCFHRANGRVLMANETMERLCSLATGHSLLNGNLLWETLKRGEPHSGASAHIQGNTLAFICADGTTFGFERRTMPYGNETVCQLMAVNITESYHLSAELGLEVQRLREMNERLQGYGDAIAGMVREEEILAAKVRIHDRLGRALIAGRMYLQQGREAVDPENLLELWRGTVGLIRHGAEPDIGGAVLEELSAAAALVGVRVVTKGLLPRGSDRAMRMMIAGAMECINNAVRHAGADEMTITSHPTTTRYSFTYTNNGTSPTGPVTEGGGLSELRRRVERLGGRMEISSAPQFSLTLSLPREV